MKGRGQSTGAVNNKQPSLERSAHLGVSVTGSAGLLSSATPRTSLPFCTLRYALRVLGSTAAPAASAPAARAATRRAGWAAAAGSGGGTGPAAATSDAGSRCKCPQGTARRCRAAGRGAAPACREPCWLQSPPAPLAAEIMLKNVRLLSAARVSPLRGTLSGAWGFGSGESSQPSRILHSCDRRQMEQQGCGSAARSRPSSLAPTAAGQRLALPWVGALATDMLAMHDGSLCLYQSAKHRNASHQAAFCGSPAGLAHPPAGVAAAGRHSAALWLPASCKRFEHLMLPRCTCRLSVQGALQS